MWVEIRYRPERLARNALPLFLWSCYSLIQVIDHDRLAKGSNALYSGIIG
jgi:hypothetical protein